MTDIVKGMAGAYLHSMDISVSENFDEVNEDAMRAALLFLADNGSEEISVRLCRVFYRIPSTDPVPMPLIDIMTDAIKEAIRAAAGGGE
jgi:hypothetical protein